MFCVNGIRFFWIFPLYVLCFPTSTSFNSACSKEKDVGYYKLLLRKKQTESKNFVLPTDNRRYFGEHIPEESTIEDYGEFDFIIVGAGSSGSVLLNRLSTQKNWTILILEAGGEEDDFSDIPSMLFYTHYSEMNWGYYTTPQENACRGFINNQCVYPRGRVLGGSSTINALAYTRGNREDYNEWERQGNPKWSYENVLTYFKKSEHFEVGNEDDYHSKSGLLNVTYMKPKDYEYLTSFFLNANKEMGYEYVDYNGENQIGVSRLQMNLNKGKRASGGRTFIDPIRHAPNVFVLTNTLATKILINNATNDKRKRAFGVNFVRNGKIYRATVRKEVILSAGAVNSPQLLMISGIGPREHLASLNIDLIQDLPVGRRMQDHLGFIGFNVRTNYTFEKPTLERSIKSFLKGRKLMTFCANSQAIKYINTLDAKSMRPDIEYLFIPPPSSSRSATRVFNMKPEILESESKGNPLTDFKLFILLLHPKSYGEITLKSKDPLDFPNINPNFLSDSKGEDIETLYRGIQHAIKMLDTSFMKKINATLAVEIPKCSAHNVKYSKEFWYCAVRLLGTTIYHTSGTTRMGPDPKTSVVNHRLKVHGIDNLRIADCGVIPSIISGHTNAAAFMIGERLADFLKKKYKSW